MTVSSHLYTSTDALTCQEKTKFYPFEIPVPHHQLRHLISTAEQNWIYLVSSYELYAIHLPSRRKSLLLTLRFSPRCLVAGLGWVCVGGEHKGASAFIRLDKDKIHTRFQVDEPSAGRSASDFGDSQGDLKLQPEFALKELGGSIVNSITLHELSNSSRFEGNEPVALLSNNDKTVKIYSLLQQQVIADLHHPFSINYALISPDSETLVAVGDSAQAYFYRRKWVPCKRKLQARFPKYEWELLSTPYLTRGDCTSDDHSFSITFSPSGHLCAISAQGGVISIFDMESINSLGAEDPMSYQSALLCSFKSSRSGGCGFVRSMAFSPAPWDLLAWGEDHGRAGIADVRQAFCRRQILQLDTEAADMETIRLDDLTDTCSKSLDLQGRPIQQCHSDTQPENAASASGSLLGGPEDRHHAAALQRHAPRRLRVGDLDPREQSVLDTLEVTMDEVDDAMASALPPLSGNYGFSPQLTRSLESEERSPSRAHLESLIDVFRERNLLRTHGNERQIQPRRRSSIVISRNAAPSITGSFRLNPGTNSRSGITSSPVRMTEDDGEVENSTYPPTLPANDISQTSQNSSSQAMPHSIPPSDLWDAIQPSFEPPSQDSSALPPSRPSLQNANQNTATDENIANRPPAGSSHTTDEAFTRTSTLPITRTSAHSQAPARPQSSQTPLRRALPLSELEAERQIRRPAFTAADIEARDGRSRPRIQGDDDRHLRILEARAQARQRLSTREHEQSSPPNPPLARTSASQRSELTGRATQTDLRLERQMMTQSARNATDGNGNWIAGEALERLLGRSNFGNANGSVESTIEREIGVGTSGLGWSENGRQLFVGTEDGIFSYTINLTDRKFFPAFDLR